MRNALWRGFVTVSEEIIKNLILCPPQHMRPGNELKLTTFALTGKTDAVPTRLKIRDRQRPLPGEVYRALFDHSTPIEFFDGKTGVKCRSLDSVFVRLYPHTDEPVRNLDGELRFSLGPKGSEPIFSQAPVIQTKFEGLAHTAVWWVASSGKTYDVSWTEPSDRILFSGYIMVMLAGLPEKSVPGAIKIDIANRVSVYDRRKDRLSSFARAEYIRRTINNGRAHTFEFINLRDVATGEVVQSGGPKLVLTGEGLKSIEEVEA